MQTDIKKNINDVLESIDSSCQQANIKAYEVSLIAVSKRKSIENIQNAMDIGIKNFGENYAQELNEKNKLLNSDIISWHFIGPLQSNKVKDAIKIFDVIETVDREKVALELKKNINKFKSFPDLYVQVNIGEEKQKNGCPPSEAKKFITNCKDYGLKINGVMAIPPNGVNPAPYFALLTNIAKEANVKNISMGMSKDFEMAIYLGSTSVRIGTKIFGERKDEKFK